MGKKGYISEFMGGGRIVSHGKIADLSKGFKLPSGNPFSVYVRPKYSVSTLDTVLTVRCSQDENQTEAPCRSMIGLRWLSLRLPRTQNC